ncbi:MAG: DUF3828 domain-containing protein [Chthoniobacterales bacterium]
MKTRIARSATRVLLLLALCFTASSMRAEDLAPAQVIRDFYRWYVAELVGDREPFEAGRADLERYISARWLKEIDTMRNGPDGLDADPFLSAQDFDKEWGNNVTVTEPVIKGAHATAEVELKGTEMGSQKLSVKLTNENGAWKIDGVEGK